MLNQCTTDYFKYILMFSNKLFFENKVCFILFGEWGDFLGGLHVTNLPIRLMCPTSVYPSTFSFPDSNSKTVSLIEFKLDREIDHHHS